jgi:hypothetical protein
MAQNFNRIIVKIPVTISENLNPLGIVTKESDFLFAEDHLEFQANFCRGLPFL